MSMVQHAPLDDGQPHGSAHPDAGSHHTPLRPLRPVNMQRATRWVWSLVGAIVAGVAVAGLARYFVGSPAGLWVDELAFVGSERGRDQLEPISHVVLSVVSVPFLVLAVAAVVAVALARRQWGDAARAVVVVVGANLFTQVFKEMVERPDLAGMPSLENSLPSGHTTVAASVSAVALLVAPRAARPLVALLGGAYTAVTAIATMSLGWHRPSDVIAAIAVVTAWTLLIMVPGSGRRADGFPGSPGRVAASLVLGGVAIGGIAVGVVTLLTTLAGVDLAGTYTQARDAFDGPGLLLAYGGSAAAVVGCAAASAWAQLLARR